MNALARRSNKGILQINKSDKESNKRKCTKGHTHIAVFFSVSIHFVHMGPEHASREKKLSMVNFLIFVHKNVYRIGFQEIKIRP